MSPSPTSKPKKEQPEGHLVEKAFVSWLRYDPLVSLVVRGDDRLRRDVMLNLLGPEAAERYFGKLPPRSPEDGPIYPSIVRDIVNHSLTKPDERTATIEKLLFWATDAQVNNRYIKSHLTRIQIVESLLGPLFLHATSSQEENLIRGLKFMLVGKQTVTGERGEQSPEVHEVVLDRVSQILIHNQQVIINKAVGEAEEKMRVHLLRQIQELRGEKASIQTFTWDRSKPGIRMPIEKFPLRRETSKHLDEVLEFYCQSRWLHLQDKAKATRLRLEELRMPLTVGEERPSA